VLTLVSEIETYLNGEIFKREQNSVQADFFYLRGNRETPTRHCVNKQEGSNACTGHGNMIHYMGIGAALVGGK